MSKELEAKQAVVGRMIPIGIGLTVAVIGVLYWIVPPLRGVETQVDRLVVALRCAGVAALPLLAGIHAIASQRGKSEAIDPLAGAGTESRALQVHIRYTQNTLEQLVLFVIVLLALSTYLDGESIRLLPVLTGAFVVGRVLFWVGYLIHPLYRSPGVVFGFLINGLSLIYILYRTLRLVFEG